MASGSHDQSKSSDSYHLSEDVSLQLTDEDSLAISLSQQDPELSKKLGILSESESFGHENSTYSSGVATSKVEGESSDNKVVVPESGSLTEFEEIEYMIKKNTVTDSDTGLSSESSDSDDETEPKTNNEITGIDTGYHSKGATLQTQEEPITASNQAYDTNVHANSNGQDHHSVTSDEESTNITSHMTQHSDNEEESVVDDTRASPLQRRRSSSQLITASGDGPSWMNRSNNDEGSFNKYIQPMSARSDVPEDEHRADTEDEDEHGEVATFGTTQDVESFLEHHLKEMEQPNAYSGSESDQSERIKPAVGSRKHQEVPQLSLHHLPTKPLNITITPSKNRTRRMPPRRPLGKTRSPAANRARRANANNRPSARIYTGSSDESSWRSDASKGELKKRLKEEAKTRKKETKVAQQLQESYDSLLMRYAEAENTIDQLRLGAKINLFADIPDLADPLEGEGGSNKQQNHQNNSGRGTPGNTGPVHSSHHTGGSSSDDMDSVAQSLKLPSAASTEFLQVALQLQCKDVKDQIAALQELLENGNLSPAQKQQAIRNIEAKIHDLENEYKVTKRTTDDENNKLMEHGEPVYEFDPDQSIGNEICRLGTALDEIKADLSPQPVASASNQQLYKQLHQGDLPLSSSDSDSNLVEGKFDDIVKRYDRSFDNDSTTAPSIIDEDEFDHSVHSVISRNSSRGRANTIPDKFFDPSSMVSNPQSDSTMVNNKSRRTSPGSRLPRPAHASKSPENHLPQRSRFSSMQSDKDSQAGNASVASRRDRASDSGFIGSESSRQSGGKPPSHALTDVSNIPRSMIPVAKQRSPQIKQPLVKPNTTPSPARKPHQQHPPLTKKHQYNNYMHAPDGNDTSFDEASKSTTVVMGGADTPPAITRPKHKRVKSTSSKRSAASSRKSEPSRDSEFDLLKEEIANLRNEINHVKQQEVPQQRTQPPPPPADDGLLNTIMHDIKSLKDGLHHQKQPDDYLTSTPKHNDSEAGTNQTRGRRSRGRRLGSRSRESHRSISPQDRHSSRHRSPSTERRKSSRSRRSDRSGSPHRHRSHSRHRSKSPGPGYWTYVPPTAPYFSAPPPPHVIEPPVIRVTPQRTSTRKHEYYASPQRTAVPFVVQQDILPSPGRIYVPVQSAASPRMYQPAQVIKPVYMSTPLVQTNLLVEEEPPLTKSMLYHSPRRRSSSLSRLRKSRNDRDFRMSTQLNDSLERAERASDDLRSHSWTLYKSMRNALNKSEVMAGEF